AGAEGVGALVEGDALHTEPAGQPLVTVEADSGVEGGVRADAHEHPPEVPVLDVEVVQLDEPAEQLDLVALAWEADGDAGVLAALEDDGDAGLAAQLLIERLDPLVAAAALGGLHDLDVPLPGGGLYGGGGGGGDGPEVGGGPAIRQAFLPEEAHGADGDLQHLDDAVEEDAVAAGGVEADGRPVVLDEGVHGGPPYAWGPPPMITEPARLRGSQGA